MSNLKRRLGIASVLGFGALLGLVTQHAVGSQKHKAARVTQPAAARSSANSFFDANGPSYSFDDSGVRAAQERAGVQAAQQAQAAQSSASAAQQPVAQSSGS